jgi:hypothetical protein
MKKLTKQNVFRAIKSIKEIDDIEIIETHCHLGSFTEILFHTCLNSIHIDILNELTKNIIKRLTKLNNKIDWNKEFIEGGAAKSVLSHNNKITLSFYFE